MCALFYYCMGVVTPFLVSLIWIAVASRTVKEESEESE